MIWKQYSCRYSVTASAEYGGKTVEYTIEIGVLMTGKTRMHSGYYCRVSAGDIYECAEAGSMYHATIKATGTLMTKGVHLHIYARQPDFYESGLSADSGWGYVRDAQKPVLMIDAVGVLRDQPFKP